jgi:hypothetical protein
LEVFLFFGLLHCCNKSFLESEPFLIHIEKSIKFLFMTVQNYNAHLKEKNFKPEFDVKCIE